MIEPLECKEPPPALVRLIDDLREQIKAAFSPLEGKKIKARLRSK